MVDDGADAHVEPGNVCFGCRGVVMRSQLVEPATGYMPRYFMDDGDGYLSCVKERASRRGCAT